MYHLTELSVVYKLKAVLKHCQYYFYFTIMKKDEHIFLIYLFSICIFTSLKALDTHFDRCLYGKYFSLLFVLFLDFNTICTQKPLTFCVLYLQIF